jgi:vanillate monooxygenase ferredoxin subunit
VRIRGLCEGGSLVVSARQVRIAAIRPEAIDIVSFELVDPQDQALPRFTPGSHIDVHVGPGLVRQYSLCNGPGPRGMYRIAVKREPGSRGGSRAMHEQVKVGDLLTISAPRNRFGLSANASHHLLLAAGIGVTPLLSMAGDLAARGASFELQYFARSSRHAAFGAELQSPRFGGRTSQHHGMEPDALAGHLRALLRVAPAGAHLYMCGPRPFMELVASIASPAWPSASVHREYFAADVAALDRPQTAFQVRLARRGLTLTVPPGRSIAEVLTQHGIGIETSCSQGVCGTCLTRVLDGVPDHRDVFLGQEQRLRNDRMLPCVSRSNSEILVLDL